MKLYYFKDPLGNFGDDLNPWLWSRLLPDVLDDRDDALFVGIGTLLNHRLPASPVKHVFGSGYGYGEKPLVDKRFVFHAVRGHETARIFGLAPETVITDAAVLVRAAVRPISPTKASRFGFMPHCQSGRYYDWASLSMELGFKHIDAQWEVERVLHEMRQCDVVICEAMHGAIVADSLRIPWIPVTCYDYISEFKWRDWLSTLEMPYLPQRVSSLYDAERALGIRVRFKNKVKRTLQRGGLWSHRWTEPPPASTGRRERDSALAQLYAASRGRTFLSADALVSSHTERYLQRLEAFRAHARAS
jgi:succinoglycan biosynthesis protein ExoV